jgi:hypothetical protein
MYNEIIAGKHLSDAFSIQNDLEKGMLYLCCFSALLLNAP